MMNFYNIGQIITKKTNNIKMLNIPHEIANRSGRFAFKVKNPEIPKIANGTDTNDVFII
ncbi:MAG: hypothetical protein WCT46_00665 [Candidatus Gracilibacteria bacterium]